jgi:hypothetical protein
MKIERGVLVQPLHHLFSFVDAQVVTNGMDAGGMLRNHTTEVNNIGDDLCLPFASETLPEHLAYPGMRSGKKIERAIVEEFVFNAHQFFNFSRFICFRVLGWRNVFSSRESTILLTGARISP